MPKKLIIVTGVFVLVGVIVFFASWAIGQPAVTFPERITQDTACPVAGCTQPDGACHAGAQPPDPDGTFIMECPRITGCTDTSCHAWDRISGNTMTSAPSDVSLNLWILAPVLLVIGLVLIVRKL